MKRFLSECKKNITGILTTTLGESGQRLAHLRSPWTNDVMRRLVRFAIRGKMIRGSLVVLGYRLFRQKTPLAVWRAAAAVELMHSSLLVHDDIMDRDRVRRGQATIFVQYEALGRRHRLHDFRQFGIASGICIGDVGYFIAFEILSRLVVAPALRQRLTTLYSDELVSVGMAQLHEMYLGLSRRMIRERDVLSVYRFKTGRYTFSVPLVIGALLAGQPTAMVRKLNRIAETLGILFQIRDDELGIFGSAARLGKPVGTDIREGKKTIFYVYLFSVVRGRERQRLLKLFGSPRLRLDDIAYVRAALIRYGVTRKVLSLKQRLAKQVVRDIARLPVSGQYRALLNELLRFNLERTK